MNISEVTSDYSVSVSVIRGNSSGVFVTQPAFGRADGLYVEPLMHGDSLISFNVPGVTLDVSATKEGEYPYFWRNVNIERKEYNGKQYHLIIADGEGVKFNRRKAFRVFVGEPGTMTKFPEINGHSVRIKDISATGIAFLGDKTEKPLCKRGDMVSVKYFDTKLKTNVEVSARVVRIIETDVGILYAASFSKLYPLVERYVAQKQLKNRNEKKIPLTKK